MVFRFAYGHSAVAFRRYRVQLSTIRLAIFTEGDRDLIQALHENDGTLLQVRPRQESSFIFSIAVVWALPDVSKDYGVSKFTVLYHHVPEYEVQRRCVTSRKFQNRCDRLKPLTSHVICTHAIRRWSKAWVCSCSPAEMVRSNPPPEVGGGPCDCRYVVR